MNDLSACQKRHDAGPANTLQARLRHCVAVISQCLEQGFVTGHRQNGSVHPKLDFKAPI